MFENQGLAGSWRVLEHTEEWLSLGKDVTTIDKAHLDKQQGCAKCGFTVVCTRCEYSKDKLTKMEALSKSTCPECSNKTIIITKDVVWDPYCKKFFCMNCIKIKDAFMQKTDRWSEGDEKRWKEFLKDLPNQPIEFQHHVEHELSGNKGAFEGTDWSCPSENHILRKWRVVHLER